MQSRRDILKKALGLIPLAFLPNGKPALAKLPIQLPKYYPQAVFGTEVVAYNLRTAKVTDADIRLKLRNPSLEVYLCDSDADVSTLKNLTKEERFENTAIWAQDLDDLSEILTEAPLMFLQYNDGPPVLGIRLLPTTRRHFSQRKYDYLESVDELRNLIMSNPKFGETYMRLQASSKITTRAS